MAPVNYLSSASFRKGIFSAIAANFFIILFACISFYFQTQAELKYQCIQMEKMEKKIDMLIEMHLNEPIHALLSEKI